MMRVYEVVFDKYDEDGEWDPNYYGTCKAYDEEDAELKIRSRLDEWEADVTVNYLYDCISD